MSRFGGRKDRNKFWMIQGGRGSVPRGFVSLSLVRDAAVVFGMYFSVLGKEGLQQRRGSCVLCRCK